MKIDITQALRVIAPGIFCSLQDFGRFGYRHLGVPCSGAMDKKSMMYVNAMVHNNQDRPVLEVFGYGVKFEVLTDCLICIGGAKALITVNGIQQDTSRPFLYNKGDVISIEKLFTGSILYLGIAGGFYAPHVMGSVSYLHNTHLSNCKKGDILYFNCGEKSMISPSATLKALEIDKNKKICVHKGPEFDRLTPDSKDALFNQVFKITPHNNRMGFRMEGQPLVKISDGEMLTSSTAPGVIQLLPDGQMIILMRDCQTTGGYPRILLVEEADINQLAQRTSRDQVVFQMINTPSIYEKK